MPGLESIPCETRQKSLKLFQRAALRSRQRASQGVTACLQRFGGVALVKQGKTQSQPARAKRSILCQGLSIGMLRVLERERRKVGVGDPAMLNCGRRRVRSSLVDSRQGEKRGDVACTLLESPTIASRRLRPREPRRRVPGTFQLWRPLAKVRSQTPAAVPENRPGLRGVAPGRQHSAGVTGTEKQVRRADLPAGCGASCHLAA